METKTDRTDRTARPPAAEDRYKTASKTERKRLAAEVLQKYRPRLEKIVRAKLRDLPEHWAEGDQVAALGLLVALERFDCEIAAYRGSTFWTFAFWPIQHELEAWLSASIFWRKETNRGKSATRRAARETARASQTALSLELALETPSDAATPEEEIASNELHGLLHEFLASLTPSERAAAQRHDKEVMSQARAFFLKGVQS
jgi:RNA polymerase sigma factor (sigma-70 family)